MRPGDSPPRDSHVAGRPGATPVRLVEDRLAMAGVPLTSSELDRVARRYLSAAGERRDFAAGLGPETVPLDGCALRSAEE